MSNFPREGRLGGRLAGRSHALAWLMLGWLLFALPAVAAEPKALDLNRASAAELEALPGIGAAKAAAIVAHRDASGAFHSVDELEAVRGIGPALVEKLRPHVTLGPKGPAPSGRKRVVSP
jgi:competence ComEA-like helix-hairpin-helix protein